MEIQLMASLNGRSQVQALRSQQIREVANAAMDRTDVLPFWFGESHRATPPGVRKAGASALERGETFYAPTLGLPALREELASYLSRLHGSMSADRIAVTSSGVSSLMIALQSLLNPGDTVIAVTPVWPNLCEIPRILGATVHSVPLEFGRQGWALNLGQLIDAIRPEVAAVIINSPNNPTGWTITRQEQDEILNRCRKFGVWLITDDVYERVYFNGPCAPSFLEIADPLDRLVSCNSFSKAWRMTGWRVGWAVVPAVLMENLSKLIEYNTSCAPGFVQAAAREALRSCDEDIEELVREIKANRDKLYARLGAVDRIEIGAAPRGGMYAFFRVRGMTNSLAFCKDLVTNAGVGIAPGSAFGNEAPEFLRWCVAADPAKLEEGLDRFVTYLRRQ
jgi:aspartate/methionine/tyrosine aminotransferase